MRHTQADPVEESAPSLLLAKPSPQGPTRKRHRFGAKIGFASRPIFSKVMLSSDKKWIIALTHHCLVCRFYECIDKARSIHSTSTKQPTKDCTRGQAQMLTIAKAITKHHLKHPTLWRKFRAKSSWSISWWSLQSFGFGLQLASLGLGTCFCI